MSPVTAIIFHGRHKKISLNFQTKMPTAASPIMALIGYKISPYSLTSATSK